MKQTLQIGFLPTLLAVLIAALAVAYPADAQTFDPVYDVSVTDNTPQTASDVQVNYDLPRGDVNFAALIQFIPPEWGIVTGDSLEIGTSIGILEAQATLGLINAACQTQLPVVFEMKNASLDVNDTVSFFDDDDNGTPDYAEDKDDNGLFDAIDKYPSFLNSVFEGLQPIRRAAGFTIVAGTPVLLQFLIFAPGTEIDELIPSDPELGFPTVTLLQNIGDDDATPMPGIITDFCSPLTTENITYGVIPADADPAVGEVGTPLFINPQDGTYTFTTFSLGLRDADGDGWENLLDTCPFTENVGDPTEANSGDLDADGLDAACDPNDDLASGGTDSDEDADGYLNRQDNCPLVANGEAEEDNQGDRDLDQIGDACDPNPDDPDGPLLSSETRSEIIIGDGSAPGGPADCADLGCFVVGTDGGGASGGDDGSDSGLIIGIIVAVIAAVVIIGGGAFLMMRRREGT